MKQLLIMAAIISAVGPLAPRCSGNENLVNISWGDNIMVGSGISKLDTPEKIRISMRSWLDNYDGKTILWRISSEYLRRFYKRQLTPFQMEYDRKVDEIASRFDPARIVREEAHKNGQLFLLYATFLDHGCPNTQLYSDSSPFPWQDQVTIANPELQERDLAGNFHYGVLDLSNPEARKFMIERLVNFVREYDSDGLYLCSRTHSLPAIHGDQFGFGPEIVREYRNRYGIDITTDPRFDYRAPEYAPASPELEAWRKLRGEYLTQFVRELRQALPPGKVLYIGLPRGNTMQCPYGNMFVDKKTMITEGLIDGMVVGVISGRFLYPKRTTPHRDLGFLESGDDNYNLPPLQEELSELARLADGKVKFFYSGTFQRTPPVAGNGLMIGAPNCRPAPYLLDTPELNSENFTVEAFVKVSAAHGAFSEAPRLISKYNHNAPDQRGWEVMFGKNREVTFRTNLVDGSGKVNDHHLSTTVRITPGEWHHVAAVFDASGGAKRLYIDGELAAESTIPDGFKLNRNPHVDVVIGSYNYGNQELRALVDELRITSSNQFNGVPSQPYTGDEPGTLALFHFDGGSGRADTAAPGVESRFIGEPVFSEGKFGSALDLTRVD